MWKYVFTIACLHNLVSVYCQTGSCRDGYTRHANSCYRFHHVELSWPESVTFCKATGSYLVRVETEAEHDFLKLKAKEMLGTYPLYSFWIGATDAVENGKWLWADILTRLVYTKWALGQPNNSPGEDCAGLYYQGGYDFGDWVCRTLLHPICEADLQVQGETVIG
ncbi:perlucin-like [Mizuhopecten yessoensis]|uniref:perlucin-like n=1 Tax=Mizuhopecten yessoensis TaxID=6573 RepID=UPI000B45A958|nr:perlucin-like [Mizuhopecten yessoensis]